MLSCEGIGLRLGGREILSRVSLRLEPGRLTAILGPNGAGKSSLLKVLAGAWTPSAGQVFASSIPLPRWDRGELSRRRAVLSQETPLTFDFQVIEIVMLGRLPHHAGRETRRDFRIGGEALEAVHAAALAGRKYLSLSGGERQRVQLARALAQIWEVPEDGNPLVERCLLLDEPVNNLDLSHQHLSLRIARKLCQENMAVLAILHDLNLAFEYADEIILMEQGRSLGACPAQAGAAETLLSRLYGWPLQLGENPVTKKRYAYSTALSI